MTNHHFSSEQCMYIAELVAKKKSEKRQSVYKEVIEAIETAEQRHYRAGRDPDILVMGYQKARMDILQLLRNKMNEKDKPWRPPSPSQDNDPHTVERLIKNL